MDPGSRGRKSILLQHIYDGCPSIVSEPVKDTSQRGQLGIQDGRTYALVPSVPERGDADVEADTERKCSSEDRGDVDT